jgi:hypothetical protein
MIIILGLIILVAAAVVGVAGVLGNSGSSHALSHFSVLGYHVTGSAGTLFFSGIVVGAAALLGLSLLLAGARRTSRRGRAARSGLRQSRRETAAATQERDTLIEQRDTARAADASQLSNGTASQGPPLSEGNDRWSRLRDLRRRLAPPPTAAPTDSAASRAAGDVPVSSIGHDVTATSPAADAPAGVPGPSISPEPDVPASASATVE